MEDEFLPMVFLGIILAVIAYAIYLFIWPIIINNKFNKVIRLLEQIKELIERRSV